MSLPSVAQLKTPFKYASEIHDEIKADFQKIKINDSCIQESEIQTMLDIVCKWLCTTPKDTTLRVNTRNITVECICKLIKNLTMQDSKPSPTVSLHSNIPELVVLHCWDEFVNINLEKYSNEIIVDAACASAVLRGAHVFAPGVMGMPRGIVVGDKVSVFADIVGQCKKGLTTNYNENNKVFVGNGIAKQTREQLFHNNIKSVSGIAVHMTDVVSKVPQMSDFASLKGNALLQNLPSIICGRILNPQPGETILDMCAAPGNKTTHISSLMKGKGIIIALEKNKSKLIKLTENCKEFCAENVKVFCCDSTKALCNVQCKSLMDGPPFNEDTFDRILLDSPCSGLGQRPQLLNTITAVQLRSYVPLQRKLFSIATRLLKPNGILVYSTCTITVAENEGIVSWALKTFPYMKLKPISEQFHINGYGTAGYAIDGLTKQQASDVRRFGIESDSVGFFIACFIKLSNADIKS